MFKTGRWRNEKHKITAVFKLHFHVTQVSEFGGSGLVLCLVPAENGKPTAKLEQCEIKENNCYWLNPVFETVKFVQDPKSGRIHDRIYYFIISTGSPKGSLVGEFSVNIADYIAATKVACVSFPFKNSNSNSHLHVSIQRILENSDQRNLEENVVQPFTPKERTLRQFFSNGDIEDGVNTNSIEDEHSSKTASPLVGLNGVRRGSCESDITLSSSDSSSGLNTPRELAVRSKIGNKDRSNGLSFKDQQTTQWDLAIVPVNSLSTEFPLNSPREVLSSDRSLMGLDDSVEKLKSDLFALSRRAEVSDLELQTLRKQIVKESKKGQDLLKEITCLKKERDALKDECEKLKTSHRRADELKVESKLQFEGDPWTLLEEIREELNYEKDLNGNLRLQLQKTQESNTELILAVQDLEVIVEKNNRPHVLPKRPMSGEGAVEIEERILKCQSDDDEEQRALEELVKQHSDAQETYLLEQKIMDLCSELEMYRRDKDELEMQMEQLALDYEVLKQENHEFSSRLEQSHIQEQLKGQYQSSGSYATMIELEGQREKLQNELKEQSRELSDCLSTMKELEAHNRSLEEELAKQAKVFKLDKEAVAHSKTELEQRVARAEEALSQSAATRNELETELQKLKTELDKQLQELSGCLVTVNELEIRNHNLEDELEKQEQAFKADMEALVSGKREQEHRAVQAEEALARSDDTINEFDRHITKLENELKTRSEESSKTMDELKELEAHIRNLEEELEKQAEGFEADLEAVTRTKVEQEKRAIQAEEALRMLRWKNANTVARIQGEFKKLSTQMRSSYEANEKLASKASTEASELRLQNCLLQDMLQKANGELQSSRTDYETKVQELNGEINRKSAQIEQMVVEFEEKSKQFEMQRMLADELQEGVSVQLLELRAETERLAFENKLLSEQAKQGEKLKSELEQMEALINHRDRLAHGNNMEGDNSKETIALVEKAEKSLDEINELRHLKDGKGEVVMNLHSEVETLRAQCDNLKHSLFEDELEKEKLRKLVFQLKTDLKKKEEMISSLEKTSKENSERVVVQDWSRATSKISKSDSVQRGSKEIGAKEAATLKEKIKFLEGQIKLKETALQTSANAFLAKEKDLLAKIGQLENRSREVSQSSPGSSQDKEKISVGMQADSTAEAVTSADDMLEASFATHILNDQDLNNSDEQTSSDTQQKASDKNSGEQQKFDILLKEMVLLKEKNNSMEIELKEMQERYSEISLRFAEVEGERQKLVMALRSRKNSNKS